MTTTSSPLDRFLLLTERQLLFHGGGIPGIQQFRAALNETFGRGLYLTSDRERAESYALFRTKTEYGGECDTQDLPSQGFQPTCYAFEITGQYLDLRIDDALEALVPHWRKYLVTTHEQILQDAQKYYATDYVHLRDLLVSAVASDISRVLGWKGKTKRCAFMTPQSYLNIAFAQFLQREGYQGLVAIEGNDRTGTLQTKEGDSWVVFDPTKVSLVEEYKVEKEF